MNQAIIKSRRGMTAVCLMSIGSALEFYDFMLFVFLAPVLSHNFFPNLQGTSGLIATFATFTMGYLARPIGGLILAHLGDRLGRKKAVYSSLLGVAIPAGLIAILPGFDQIGIYAPICLVALRLLQGFALGGEVPGALVYCYEYFTTNNRCIAIALIFFSLTLAVLFAQMVVMGLQQWLGHTAFAHYGWRLCFVIAGLLAVVGVYWRQSLQESPVYQQAKLNSEVKRLPLTELLACYWQQCLAGYFITGLAAACMVIFLVYMPTFLMSANHIAHYTHQTLQYWNTVNLLSFSMAMLLFASLADRVGAKKILLAGSGLLLILLLPLWFMMTQCVSALSISAWLVLGVLFAMISASYAYVLTQLFPTHVRYSGVALVYNTAFATIGSTAPLISTSLLHMTGHAMPPAYYLGVLTLIAVIITWRSK